MTNTPTTEEVRTAYSSAVWNDPGFDRWLEARDEGIAAAAVKALNLDWKYAFLAQIVGDAGGEIAIKDIDVGITNGAVELVQYTLDGGPNRYMVRLELTESGKAGTV